MKKMVFLNATQHNLIKRQVERIKEKWGNIDILDIKNFTVFEKIKNSSVDRNELEKQVDIFVDFIDELLKNKYEIIILHLPIGSPAFMYLLTLKLNQNVFIRNNIKVVFSHTERKMIENIDDNGNVIKKSVFDFVDFIEM